MTSFQGSETSSCQSLITAGSWFTMQVPNMLWFLALLAMVVGGLVLPFPSREIDREGEGP